MPPIGSAYCVTKAAERVFWRLYSRPGYLSRTNPLTTRPAHNLPKRSCGPLTRCSTALQTSNQTGAVLRSRNRRVLSTRAISGEGFATMEACLHASTQAPDPPLRMFLNHRSRSAHAHSC
jgi:hypothetical protein